MPPPPPSPDDPSKVIVGAYINDIQELDFKTNSYAVDLYVWFRWKPAEECRSLQDPWSS